MTQDVGSKVDALKRALNSSNFLLSVYGMGNKRVERSG